MGVHLRVSLAGAAVREVAAQEAELRAVLPVGAVTAEPGDTGLIRQVEECRVHGLGSTPAAARPPAAMYLVM
jgi:hypothetical protein